MLLNSIPIKKTVQALSNNVRAENIDYDSYVDLYAGVENIENINNRNNTVIYGRRGSGKTHLLRALAERIGEGFHESRNFPVYVDLRRIIPLVPSGVTTADVDAILIFKYVIQGLAHSVAKSLPQILGVNEFDPTTVLARKVGQEGLIDLFERIYLQFDGKEFKKPSALTVSEEEVSAISGAATLSVSPSAKLEGKRQRKEVKDTEKSSYISILDITDELERLLQSLDLNRITLLIDEWSEIDQDTQLFLAEIIKKTFSAIAVTLKIAAIPNRTNLGIKTEKKFFGLEDGGDIFGYPLDMRYVFEVNKTQTRDFFNNLLYKHLSSINQQVTEQFVLTKRISPERFINQFFANVALNEILVASAGVPRDFMNLFINSYDKYIIGSNSSANRISVKNLRSANSEWYETDKKEQVDKHHIERQLLVEIVQEVIEKKRSVHFLIPERHSANKHIQNLIDFRVIHLRKSGYSHKDHPGVSYNVYSIDYGCYNSLNITKNKLDTSMMDSLNLKDLREIRRVSLEDNFFQKFLMNIGEAFSCPHCGRPVDTNHLAYKKQKLCNNCYESVGVDKEKNTIPPAA
ncbi:hypothetical protein KDH83_30075 [Achromobacter sp. Marseille-Q0513]|uniref:ORC-CDC6 family AAA ATPase n=1 Tax=Achromobacter sp. Marseille-Q0513 TaxID=2829161 RepID=UPI001B954331|nr:hypothetical protein [Achromobacter sp. Marseille-Q0513]MBR8657571.1 hypothetical protein [Achromobacter sp. Marseille-Q0513]